MRVLSFSFPSPDLPVDGPRALQERPRTVPEANAQLDDDPGPERLDPGFGHGCLRIEFTRAQRLNRLPPRAGDDPRTGILVALRAGTARRRHLQLSQLRHRLAVAGALGQHVVPQLLGLGLIAAFGGQGRQVAPGTWP